MPRTIDRYQVSLKAILKNERGEILGLKAQGNGTMAGFYDLPGGRIDVEEFRTPLIDCIRREIQEECGDIRVEVDPRPIAYGKHLIAPQFTKDGQEIHVLYLFFEVKFRDGDIVISDEHTDHRWLDPAAINLEEYFNSGNLEGLKMYLGRN